jgi:calcineurin-like phosphoesterase family protein
LRNVWVTADQHFDHYNILELAKRPFDTVEEMNQTIIDNFNSLVKKGDLVYHLGDLGFGDITKYIKQLKGAHYLIKGNHDKLSNRIYNSLFQGVWDYRVLKEKGYKFVLFHYPIRDWQGMYGGWIHLYGHVHSNIKPRPGSFEVGVDATNYYPINIDSIIEWSKTYEII